jgi:alkanesulfonate monooxygenase SsuD/methylene tetrahydromethanopterin reductase-like flavin-dependent oxidoreductase (luciferase family)
MQADNPTERLEHPWVRTGGDGMRFGLAYGPRTDWLQCRDFVQMIEALGFDSFWVMDHPTSGMDAWSLLSALASTTRSIRLGPLVSCVCYRSPITLARLAADVDRLSMGRLVLGLGIGNHQVEFARMGIPFLSARQRQQALEETVQILCGLWSEQSCSFTGEYFQVQEAQMRCGPVQQPYVPLLIAGGGEQRTLRQVARSADISHFGAGHWAGGAASLEDIKRKYVVLKQHCLDYGRDYQTILRSYGSAITVVAETQQAVEKKLNAIPERVRSSYTPGIVAGTPDEMCVLYQGLAEAGVEYFMAGIFGDDRETVQLLARHILPVFAASRTA